MGTPGVEAAVLRNRRVVSGRYPLTWLWLWAEEHGDVPLKAKIIEVTHGIIHNRYQRKTWPYEAWANRVTGCGY